MSRHRNSLCYIEMPPQQTNSEEGEHVVDHMQQSTQNFDGGQSKELVSNDSGPIIATFAVRPVGSDTVRTGRGLHNSQQLKHNNQISDCADQIHTSASSATDVNLASSQSLASSSKIATTMVTSITTVAETINHGNSEAQKQTQIASEFSSPENGIYGHHIGNRKKSNGLRNRIIQRPPPLILDKVSNFYSNDTKHRNDQTLTSPSNERHNASAPTTSSYTPTTLVGNPSQTVDNENGFHHQSSQSANHKFWASLNANNVAREKINPGTKSTVGEASSMNSITSSSRQLIVKNTSNERLGDDLVITHRSRGSAGLPTHSHRHQSHSSKRHQQVFSSLGQSETDILERDADGIQSGHLRSESRVLRDAELDPASTLSNVVEQSASRTREMSTYSSEPDDGCAMSDSGGGNLIGVDNVATPTLAPESELGGRQLFYTSHHHHHLLLEQPPNEQQQKQQTQSNVYSDNQPPPIGSINRPRSNNPFLNLEDTLAATLPVPIDSAGTVFGSDRRVAHDRASYQSINGQSPEDQQYNQDKFRQHQQQSNESPQSGLIQQSKRSNASHINEENKTSQPLYYQHHGQHFKGALTSMQNEAKVLNNTNPTVSLDSHAVMGNCASNHPQPNYRNQHDQRDTGLDPEQAIIIPSDSQYRQRNKLTAVINDESNIYGSRNNTTNDNMKANYINYEPPISSESEQTVSKLPSANMQSPYWTDAIYILNNAILEANSVAGGAEIGEFIHIVESGDIILELDSIGVSGMTLAEFNELLESKQTHLLSAVQTKHSHGLSKNLKHYLNCSFPKNSRDGKLQELIRENIYRRTIPCTTRPPKEGEIDKVDYHFLTKEQFIEMSNRGMLLECGSYGGHFYGTMRPFSDPTSLSSISNQQFEISDDMRQPLNANHPAIGFSEARKDISTNATSQGSVVVPALPPANGSQMQTPIFPEPLATESLYANHAPMRLHQMQQNAQLINRSNDDQSHDTSLTSVSQPRQLLGSSIVAVDSEALPMGWERVIDQTHGVYYIDHNTMRTQYERPYEIELTKGQLGFGFTLVEAENGMLLVRSVIPGGPANASGIIQPGDILISAVGVPVAGLQHRDIARLFSTFAVGDRVRLVFARGQYTVDQTIVPDEYLITYGTNGDLGAFPGTGPLTFASANYFDQNLVSSQNPHNHILVDQQFEFINVVLKRSEQGFGFIISNSLAGQKVTKIQNKEICSNLRQGDILVYLNGEDVSKLGHAELVERLKRYPTGHDLNLIVRRKKRFRSKTPMMMPSEKLILAGESSLDRTPLRNCKTPSLDEMMLRRSSIRNSAQSSSSTASRRLFDATQRKVVLPQESQARSNHDIYQSRHDLVPRTGLPTTIYPDHRQFDNNQNHITSQQTTIDPPNHYQINQYHQQQQQQPIYDTHNQVMSNNELYCNQAMLQPQQSSYSLPVAHISPPSVTASEGYGHSSLVDQRHLPEPPLRFANMANGVSSQYKNFLSNDKLMMMQMHQQPKYPHEHLQPVHQQEQNMVPLYSNSEMLRAGANQATLLDNVGAAQYYDTNNYYANNSDIVSHQYLANRASSMSDGRAEFSSGSSMVTHQAQASSSMYFNGGVLGLDEVEFHQVELERPSTDYNWGIRIIGGAEVDRAISIGSIVLDGVAYNNGRLKSGDEIVSINGENVEGATHQGVVDLISSCTHRASLVVRRKRFAETSDVLLTRDLDEGFGFVIISSGNCPLIGRIIEGSPADRCKQLHVKDRIIAVNGRFITPQMQHPEIVNMIKECGSTLRLRIIPADCYTVELIKNAQSDDFGFAMRSGSDYDGMPLYILRVAPDGLARDLLNVGDQIIEINDMPTVGMTHQQASNIIKLSETIVKLKLRRNHVALLPNLVPPPMVDSAASLQHPNKFNKVTAEMKTIGGAGVESGSGPSNSAAANPSSLQEGSLSSPEFGVSSLPSQQSSNQNLLFNQHPQNDNNQLATSIDNGLSASYGAASSANMPLFAS